MENIGLYILACEYNLDIFFSSSEPATAATLPGASSTRSGEGVASPEKGAPASNSVPSAAQAETASSSVGSGKGASQNDPQIPVADGEASSPRRITYDNILSGLLNLKTCRNNEVKKVLSACETAQRELQLLYENSFLQLTDQISGCDGPKEKHRLNRSTLAGVKEDGKTHFKRIHAVLESMKDILSAEL